MANGRDRLSLRYRMMFYLSGFIFATASFIAGLSINGSGTIITQSMQIHEIIYSNTLYAFQHYPWALFSWQVLCMIIAATMGYLLDREVHYRRKAELRANIDGLTEVYNHRYFQDRLGEEISRANRYNRPLSLIMLDLDDFKIFNDTWGHQEGDNLLYWFAALCGKCIRNIDILARYGGEEFVILLPETDSKAAFFVAKRIRDMCEKQSLAAFGKNKGITVSAGLATYPQHAKTAQTLVLNADAAMYYAKRLGKNECIIYEEEYHRPYRASSGHVNPMPNEDLDLIRVLGDAADSKDLHGEGHSMSVTQLSAALAEKIGLSAEEISNLRAAALLHDLGKLATPPELFTKSGPLEKEDWKLLCYHPKLGADILERVQEMNSIIPGVKYHHERYDGKGYPEKLEGKNIPLFARIISIADAYDAMTNTRSYRAALSMDDAINEIKRCAGTQFDPELVEAFVSYMDKQKKNEQAA